MGITVLAQQTQDLRASCPGGQNHRNPDTLPGTQVQPLAQAEDRVNDIPLAVSRFLNGAHRAGERSPPSNEPGPVGLVPKGFGVNFVFKRKAVPDAHRGIALLAGPPVRKNRVLSRYRLRLNEKLIESGMLPVSIVRRHREFNVTRQIETAGPEGTINQSQSPDFDVVLRSDDDFRLALYVVVDAPEHDPVQRKVGAIVLNIPSGRLIGVAPQPVRICVMDIAERPPGIRRTIRPPSRYLKATPVAVAAAGVREHQAIASVGEELGLRRGGMGSVELAHGEGDFSHSSDGGDPHVR